MPAKVRFDIEGVRVLVRKRVGQSSLRAVADEVGMSNSGLYSFLQGGQPYSLVRKKLVAWFMRAKYPEARHVAASEVDAAASLLAAYIRQTRPSARGQRFMKISEQIATEGELSPDSEDVRPTKVYPKKKRRGKK